MSLPCIGVDWATGLPCRFGSAHRGACASVRGDVCARCRGRGVDPRWADDAGRPEPCDDCGGLGGHDVRGVPVRLEVVVCP